MKNEGRLSKDGFAIAMHLIQNKLAGKDVPASLPPTLIPPSMRGVAHSAVHSQIEPLRDLFWDDTPPSSSTAAPLQPQSTGTMHTRPPPPAVPARVAVNATVDPFNAGPFGNPACMHAMFGVVVSSIDFVSCSP
jgi:epidermal growth factor receptor substrate 15